MPTPPLKPYPPPSYGLVHPRDGRGIRFIGWALLPEQAAAFEALARQLGLRPTETSHFLTESRTH